MNKIWWLAPLVVAAAGCSTPAVPSSIAPAPMVSQDSSLLAVVHSYAIDGTSDSLIATAHKICDLAPTMPFSTVVHTLANDTGLSLSQAGAFYGAAVTTYCPSASTTS